MFKKIREHYKDYGTTWNYRFDPRYLPETDRKFLKAFVSIIVLSLLIWKVSDPGLSVVIAFIIVWISSK